MKTNRYYQITENILDEIYSFRPTKALREAAERYKKKLTKE